jgi:hypothetical protein
MEKKSNHIKARIYIGGLRSLFEDMAGILAEIEKTGSVPDGIVESLNDISEAINLTIARLKSATVKCCVHGPEVQEDVEDDDDEVEDSCEECECEEKETPPPSEKKSKKSTASQPKKTTKK